MSAKDKQVGGGHYKDMPIQPIDFIVKNGLPFIEGCIVKYISRWRSKGGVEDLRKVIHYVELLIEAEAEKAELAEATWGDEALDAKARRQERASVQLGHPRIGDSLTPAAVSALKQAFGPKGDPGNPEWPLRCCTCQGSNPSDPDYQCQCPPVLADCHCPPDRPLDAVNRAPVANSEIPGVCVPEGGMWPQDVPDGTRILAWRPRKPGDPGAHLYGWVEIGFMWGTELVRYDAQG